MTEAVTASDVISKVTEVHDVIQRHESGELVIPETEREASILSHVLNAEADHQIAMQHLLDVIHNS